MYEYSRCVYYYETDKMGVVHHSNYVRWLEEGRTFFFDDSNLVYAETESSGVFCPVTDMSMRFKSFTRYGDRFTVRLRLIQYTGVRFRVEYTVVNQNGDVLLTAESGHAFVSVESYRPVTLSKALPERHEIMTQPVEQGGEDA